MQTIGKIKSTEETEGPEQHRKELQGQKADLKKEKVEQQHVTEDAHGTGLNVT